jgi:transcriptional regulator with XRE-family HTH domain
VPIGPRLNHPIRAVLVAGRISYVDHAEEIGYSPAYIEAVCNGRTSVTAEFARRASEALGLPAHELFAGIEPPRSKARPGERQRRSKTVKKSAAAR